MNKYILQKLATDNKISVKQTEEIIDGFYRGLKYYLEHAEETEGGILIKNYLKFHIDLHREMRSIERSLTENKEPKRIKVFQNLIKHNKKRLSKRDYERQTRIESYYEQYASQNSSRESEEQNGE